MTQNGTAEMAAVPSAADWPRVVPLVRLHPALPTKSSPLSLSAAKGGAVMTPQPISCRGSCHKKTMKMVPGTGSRQQFFLRLVQFK